MSQRYPFARRAGALWPASKEAAAALAALKRNTEVMVAFRPARNVRQHRLLFAMLNVIVDHGKCFPDTASALIGLKIACGLVDVHIGERGKAYFIPRSIAFESMAQDEFAVFFDRAVAVITERWFPAGTRAADVRAEIEAMVNPPQPEPVV